MTMMVKTLVALRDEPADWKNWQLDYHNHTDLMGEISGPRGDSYYGPPKKLEKAPGVQVVEADVGFVIAELDHATLLRFWDPDTQVKEAYGQHPPAQAVGKRIDGLDPGRRYAVIWLEVY